MAKAATLETIYRRLGKHACAATRAEYVKAMGSLSAAWSDIRSLPCDLLYYETMADYGLIERATETFYAGSASRGGTIKFRRNERAAS